MLHEFWQNFAHNLFKPLLLFFYLGFLITVLKVRFEFPYVIYQGLTIYLLLAIGWRGGEALAHIDPRDIGNIAGFVILGFVWNFANGAIAYFLLNQLTAIRRVDKATVASYYASDGAGSFAACMGLLTVMGVAFDAYMPVMLAIMEIPGCLLALYLVGRLRRSGMDATGLMPDEAGYTAPARTGPGAAAQPVFDRSQKGSRVLSRELLGEVFLNPGLGLLIGGIVIGFISGLQGVQVVRDDDAFFVSAFHGALCLFLLEMGITAARKLRDLRSAGRGFIVFGLLAPNLFAMLGISVAHGYALVTHTDLKPGTYVLFAILCAAASYIAVPAVQRLAIPEASPTLPLAASLGLTFSYNVTIGIPVYIEIARLFS
ncbi:sodium-dependent bicarbonate transport family permease [Mycobacterium decipiens]|uniref:Sodium-dependent bicarbonate transport family permease n=1 Tax=Mycobacterium decipiens TaxID=1430326 RepID=A0A1X2LW84_9MYCO|nr:sodium-dependent bicarbonate transport family permease [Mycobacterium decipiens]OSC41420.1 sodium-dependent bicarbonate transport family permease [Mycobacterium decipiens]